MKVGDLVRVVSYQGHVVARQAPLFGVVVELHKSPGDLTLVKLRIKGLTWVVYDYEVEVANEACPIEDA